MNSPAMAKLFLAVYMGELATVKSIVEETGIDVDASDDIQGSTALLWASFGGSVEVATWLVEEAGASLHHKNKDGRNALFFACEHCHMSVAAYLVMKGVDVNATDISSGQTPLHRACIAGQTREQPGAEELVSWLLAKTEANPDTTDCDGRKPGERPVEGPALKLSESGQRICKMLQEARAGKTACCSGAAVVASAAPTTTAPSHVTSIVTTTATLAVSAAPAPAPSIVAMRAAALAASIMQPAVATRDDIPLPAPVQGGTGIAARAASFAASLSQPVVATRVDIPLPVSVQGGAGIAARAAAFEATASARSAATADAPSSEPPALVVSSRVAELAAALTAPTRATMTTSAAPQAAVVAHAVIAASNAPKASALVATFGGKAHRRSSSASDVPPCPSPPSSSSPTNTAPGNNGRSTSFGSLPPGTTQDSRDIKERADDTRVRMYTGFNVDSGRRFLEGKGGYERHDSATTEYPMRYGPEHCPMRQLGGRAGLSSCGQSKSEKPAPQEGGPQGGAEDEGSENDAQDGDDDGKGEKGWRYRFPTTRELCMVSALGVVGGGLWFGLSMLKRRR